MALLLVAGTLLGAKGIATRSKDASECEALEFIVDCIGSMHCTLNSFKPGVLG